MTTQLYQWKCTAYRGKNRDIILQTTFVRASTCESAKEIGKLMLKHLGVRGRFQVSVSNYSPLTDLAFTNYVAAVND